MLATGNTPDVAIVADISDVGWWKSVVYSVYNVDCMLMKVISQGILTFQEQIHYSNASRQSASAKV